ncbi:helix-turn-helix domain-containing protein [Pseudomonas veronii]|uniref:helix-turn-helix domain-containing protein n=1 Tax=Pseudomonas veronii TaxID=76761 RepID=UPI0015A036E6|nr:helix-turn-helix domain-containing protein [Pseudomonas veronii]NWD56315.1 helix-turn-helix domain-containing protein [Pseudomonas veronii]
MKIKQPYKVGTAPACHQKITELLDTSCDAQVRRVAEILRKHQPSTFELRDVWNVMQPAARIFTLRHDLGWEITTVFDNLPDAYGRPHRGVGRYVLLKEGAPV